MAKESVQIAGTSIPVQNVQSLAASINADSTSSVPPRYIRPEAKSEPFAHRDECAELPVIDFAKLLDHHSSQEESAKLHHVCSDWGFFQLINHGVAGEVIEKMKTDTAGFFELPLEEKKAFAQQPNNLQGYGQAFVVSDEQKLDWADVLYLIARPLHLRDMRFWPIQPPSFRDTLYRYSLEVKSVARALMEVMAKNLGVAPDEFCDNFRDQPQGIRINYYPPCPKADEVLGLSAHTDGSGLTLLLQVSDVQGLQIKKDEKWLPVKPLPGAFLANIGDIIEILSNGKYKSVEHRAVINREKERLSIAAFHGPRDDAVVGPLPELVKECSKKNYPTMEYREFMRTYFSRRLDGRSLLESLKL